MQTPSTQVLDYKMEGDTNRSAIQMEQQAQKYFSFHQETWKRYDWLPQKRNYKIPTAKEKILPKTHPLEKKGRPKHRIMIFLQEIGIIQYSPPPPPANFIKDLCQIILFSILYAAIKMPACSSLLCPTKSKVLLQNIKFAFFHYAI